MLTHRIIPCLDVKAGRVVKGVNFLGLRDAGDPVEVARRYDREGADELVFLDITASHEGRGIMLDVVRRVAEQCFMPFTVGGGIRTIEDVTALIQAGAEKVSINTAAVVDPDIVRQTARRFGRCATVVNIDPKRIPVNDWESRMDEAEERLASLGVDLALYRQSLRIPSARDGFIFEVHTHGGRKPTGLEAVAWARTVVELGAGEIVLTSMDADGTKNGYDLEMTAAVAAAVDVPVVASGGCGSPEHIRQVLAPRESGDRAKPPSPQPSPGGRGSKSGGAGADAALAASIFHYGQFSIQETKRYLAQHGVAVRLT